MFAEKNCKFCLSVFMPSTANQQYCCRECKRASVRERDRRKSKKIISKRRQPLGINDHPQVDDIIYICKKVKEKTGKIVGYGLVSYLSDNGKLDVLGVEL